MKAGAKGRLSSRLADALAVMNYNFPQTMLMIIKALIVMLEIRAGFQTIEIKQVSVLSSMGARKKGI